MNILQQQPNLNVFTQVYSEQLKDSYIRQLNLVQFKIAQQYWNQCNRSVPLYANTIQNLNQQLKILGAQQFAFQADIAQITYQTRGFKPKQLESIQSNQTITFGHFLPVISSRQNQNKFIYDQISSGGSSVLQQSINHLNCLLTTQVLINATKNPMLVIQCNPTSNSCILQHQQLNEVVSNVQAQDIQLETNILKAVHSLAQLIYMGHKHAKKAEQVINQEIQALQKEESIPLDDKRCQLLQKINNTQSKQYNITTGQQLIDNDELQDVVDYSVQRPGQLYAYQPDQTNNVIIIPNSQHTLYVYPAKRNISIYETINLIAEFLRLQTIAESQQTQKPSQLGLIPINFILNGKLLQNIFISKYIIEYNQQIIQLLGQINQNQQNQDYVYVSNSNSYYTCKSKNNYIPSQILQYNTFIQNEKKKQRINQLIQQQKQIQEDEQPGDCLICGYKFDNYKNHIFTSDHIRLLQKEFEHASIIKNESTKLQRLQILKSELEEIRDDGILAQAQQQLCKQIDKQQDTSLLSQQSTKQIQELLDKWQIPISLEQNIQILQDQFSMKYKEDQMLKRQSAMEQILTGVGSRKSGYKRIKQVSELFCQCCADVINGQNPLEDEINLDNYIQIGKTFINGQYQTAYVEKFQEKEQSNWKYGYNDDPKYLQLEAIVFAILLNTNIRKIQYEKYQQMVVYHQLSQDEFNNMQKQTQRSLDIQFNNLGSQWNEQLNYLNQLEENIQISFEDQKDEQSINFNKLKNELNQIEIGVIPNSLEIVKLYCIHKQIEFNFNQLIQIAQQKINNQEYQKYVQMSDNKVQIILQNQKMQLPIKYIKNIEQECKQQIKTKQTQQRKYQDQDKIKINKVIQQLSKINTKTIHSLFEQQKYNLIKSQQQDQFENGELTQVAQVANPIIHNDVVWQGDKWIKKEKQNKGLQQTDSYINSAFSALNTMCCGPLCYQQISSLIWSTSADVLVSASQCIDPRNSGISYIDTFDIASLMICGLKARQGLLQNQKSKSENYKPTQMEIMCLDSITTSLYQTNTGE